MNKIFLSMILLFFLVCGFVSGLAYERYIRREQCLKMAFQNNTETLSEAEIGEILRNLNSPKKENENNNSVSGQKGADSDKLNGQFVGSKNSNKFYPADCRYAKLIKEGNKVFFESVEEGEKEGREYVECK
ncbi:MAG: hypothetical protein FJZ04_01085 [Candidatus Moranbacteria bacterium]|nr:hypothetical protein [Candidatus Moranbacteria bacterium]